jgi:hypothetical protein
LSTSGKVRISVPFPPILPIRLFCNIPSH